MSVEAAIRSITTYINRQIRGVAAFRATVTDASGGTLVKIQREGASTADTELYATCSRYTLTNGDVVLCLPLGPNGKPVIVEVIQPPAAGGGGGGGAPTTAKYITQTADAGLSAEQALASLSTGMMQSTTTTGVVQTRTLTGTANEVTVTNGDGSAGNPTFGLASGISATKIGGGAVSSTEFDYLNGVTSGIQTQIDGKVSDTGDTMTGALVVNVNSTAALDIQSAGVSSFKFDSTNDKLYGYDGADITLHSDTGATPKLTLFGSSGNLAFGNSSSTNVSIRTGTGSPESVVTAVIGSIFLRSDGGTDTAVYRKESGTGNTGWVAVSSSGSGLGFAAVQRLIAIGAPL